MKPAIKPLPDETFSSLLFRTAQSRCQSVTTTAENSLALSYHQARSDLDRLLPSQHPITLLRGLGTSPIQINKLSIPREWITSVWDNVSRHYHGPIRLCGACLQESRHGRKFWRTKFAAACPDHGLELIEVCPHCATPIPYFGSMDGLTLEHWLEAWPICRTCFRSMDVVAPAHPVLIRMSHRWRRALLGKPQYAFTADEFLRLSAKFLCKFHTIEHYREVAEQISPNSYWRGHLAAALMIRSITRKRARPDVCYAAAGMEFDPIQLAKDIIS